MVVDQALNTLIFDFDGTLFHLPVDYAAVRRDLGLTEEARIGPLLQHFLDEGDTAGLAVVTRHEVAAVAQGGFTPGARECLGGKGNLAILTRNSGECVRAALGELAQGVLIVGREDVRALKPDPEGVRAVLDHFRADARKTALIGDTYHDVEAARAAGVSSVVVRNPLLEYAPLGADHYIDELAEMERVLAC